MKTNVSNFSDDDDDEDFELGFGGATPVQPQAGFTNSISDDRHASSQSKTQEEDTWCSSAPAISQKAIGREAKPKVGGLVMQELDDFDDYAMMVASRRPGGNAHSSGRKGVADSGELQAGAEPTSEVEVDIETALALRRLTFGDPRKAFNDAWLQQGFTFVQDVPDLGFGLIQFEGGPCGVIASMQAFVLKELLFGSSGVSNADLSFSQPSASQQESALIKAIVSILWQAGSYDHAVVALPKGRAKIERSSAYRPDGVTEKLNIYTFHKIEGLEAFIRRNLKEFTSPKGSGVVSLVYSTILSRGISNVEADMDSVAGFSGDGEGPKLMSSHGYASQEMVNLFLVGHAHSNVFDGEQVLEGEGSDVIRLRGVPKKSTLGFLTLFEAYQYVAVGSNYKVPDFPIWVICSESHYSTIFSLDSSLLNETSIPEIFDLHYFDGLGRQEEVIKLTISLDKPYTGNDEDDQDLTPPIDKVIRTKWKGACVNWNGSEPIL